MKVLIRVLLGLGALVFIALAAYYWVTPANALLQLMPGYDPSDAQPHTKHALAAGLLAAGCLIVLWFSTGKKDAPTVPSAPAE